MSINAVHAAASRSQLPSLQVTKATAAAQDFTAMFATQMLAPMWEGVDVNEYFGGGHGEEVFRGLLLQEYGKVAAADDSFGLAGQVRSEMLKLQESLS
ncbi:MAG: rod-binding protein [Alphaproteobacteria bacterium]